MATVARAPLVNLPAATAPLVPVVVRAAAGSLQANSLAVSSPSDRAEREAAETARRVVTMPSSPAVARAPFVPTRAASAPHLARFAGAIVQREPVRIARKEADALRAPARVATEISAAQSGGNPLPPSVRAFMEPRFRADFGGVRVHTDDRAARLATSVRAQAFTVGNQIFFGKDRFRPESAEGRELLAHELTHTIQQGSVAQQGSSAQQGSGSRVQRSLDPTIAERAPVQVQRLGVGDVLDFFADRANAIPGFRMFTILLGVNPINQSRVERSAANILRAIVEFLPGGNLITMALDAYGVFERAGAWIEQQLRTLGISGTTIRQAIDRFLDSLSFSDIFDLGGVWERARRIFSEPIDRILSFVRSLGGAILRFIRDAILRPLAALAQGTRGYDLLKAVLGQDPITGDPVPRNAETLIGGFMRLIGQEEVWNNLVRSNAVARAWAWFQSTLSELLGFVRQIPGLFVQALTSLEVADLVLLPRAFARVARVFGDFLGRYITWAGTKVLNLLEIIFDVLAPAVMPYLRKAAGAFRTIIQNPIGFIGNLVRAGIQGLRQFATNFLTHLRTSLIGWLTGTLSGANIYIPQAFTLQEIVKFVLSVLGLTWQNIRQKLVRVIGEPATAALETGFDIVVTLVTQGPAAAWERIRESLSNLREMVMEQVMNFVLTRVVQAAITRLVTSLNPAGAFIQAIIAIYNTVMFFVERLRQIAQVAAAFIDSISAIASGVISAAANRVEQTMAGLLTLVISFLARIAGLGRVSDAVINIVNRVRAPIDRALDRVVEWIVAQARRLGRAIAQAGVPQDPNERLRRAARDAVAAARRLTGRVTRSLLDPVLAVIKVRYGLRDLQAYENRGNWWVRASINPEIIQDLGVTINPADVRAGTPGVLDLYRGIHYRNRPMDPADALDPQQLIREEDFSEAVFSVLGITRGQAETATLAQKQAAAQTVVTEVQNARSIAAIRPWWRTTRRPSLFLAMLQRFVNRRTAFQNELQTGRVAQLAGFSFTDIPFISTTKNPQRAAQFAFGVVVATSVPAQAAPAPANQVLGKVFVYLFSGTDLEALRAVDIQYTAQQGQIAPHARYSKADAEVTFTGSIPANNRIGEILVRASDSMGGVAVRARQMANTSASGQGGLLPWS